MTRFTTWAGHTARNTGWDPSPRAALGGLALVGGLALLAAFYLALSSQTAVLGRHLQDMEYDLAQTVRENASLRAQIAHDAGASQLMKRALDAGYVTTGTVLFLPVTREQDQEIEQPQAPP